MGPSGALWAHADPCKHFPRDCPAFPLVFGGQCRLRFILYPELRFLYSYVSFVSQNSSQFEFVGRSLTGAAYPGLRFLIYAGHARRNSDFT